MYDIYVHIYTKTSKKNTLTLSTGIHDLIWSQYVLSYSKNTLCTYGVRICKRNVFYVTQDVTHT